MILNNISFNEYVMMEIGLAFNPNDQRVIDQDNGTYLTAARKFMSGKPRADMLSSDEQLFDPLHNIKQMQLLFGYYASKLQAESGLYIDTVYVTNEIPATEESPIRYSLAIKVIKPSAERIELISLPYVNESVKYADLISQLNGGRNVNLSQYDIAYT